MYATFSLFWCYTYQRKLAKAKKSCAANVSSGNLSQNRSIHLWNVLPVCCASAGAIDYEFYCLLYELEHVYTRLDTPTPNFIPNYCNKVTVYTNCCHEKNWSMFRNSQFVRTLTYSAVLVAFKTFSAIRPP